MRHFFHVGSMPAGEPARDARLGALLRDVTGDAPVAEVDWDALAERIRAAVRDQNAAPWWSYAERWQRRAIPIALAAGFVGALAFFGAVESARPDPSTGASTDVMSAVVAGTSSSEAATTFARSVTSIVDLAVGLPE